MVHGTALDLLVRLVAVIVLKGLALRRKFVVPPEIEKEVDLLRQDDQDGLARLGRMVRNDPSAMGRIVATGLQHLGWPKSENVEAVQTRARHEIVRLESGLFVLEVIVGIAPLLGLLGAVSGLMTVFGAFGASASQSDPHLIASGISEALSTTIVGLGIAIPSLIAYSYFSKKVETMAAENGVGRGRSAGEMLLQQAEIFRADHAAAGAGGRVRGDAVARASARKEKRPPVYGAGGVAEAVPAPPAGFTLMAYFSYSN